MSMVINNNLAALTTYDTVNATSAALEKSIKKLSTGLRINSAADDAAGLAISEKMRAQISGLDRAVSNTQDGISLIQTAEGALSQTHSILQRMRELSVQAANDTLTAQDRSYIQEEIDQLKEEIDHIGNTTTFNNKNLLNGDSAVLWSSSDLNTRAIVNGGLRTVDQFGQKSSVDGNFKITVKASAGANQVQKTDIFKIKHDIDFDVEGTSKFNGAALEKETNVAGVGSRQLKIAVEDFAATAGKMEYTITLRNDVKDAQGLADAINSAMAGVTTKGISSADAVMTDKYDLVTATVTNSASVVTLNNYKVTAGVDSNGNLTLTNDQGYKISLSGGANTDDLKKILGRKSDSSDSTATIFAQDYEATLTLGKAATPNTWATDIASSTAAYTFSVTLTHGKADSSAGTSASVVNVSLTGKQIWAMYDSSVDAATTTAISKLKEEIVNQLNTNSVGLTASLDSNENLKLVSKGGAITVTDGPTNKLMDTVMKQGDMTKIQRGATTYTNVADTYTNKFTGNKVDTQDAATNFARNFNNTTVDSAEQFRITVGSTSVDIKVGEGTTLKAKFAADSTYEITVDDLVTDIKEQLAASETNYLADVVTVQNVDGNVRMFAQGKDLTIQALKTGTTAGSSSNVNFESGTLNAIFGNISSDAGSGLTVETVDSKGQQAGLIQKIVQKSQDAAGGASDILGLDRDYSFKVNDTNGEVIASIALTGPFDSLQDVADQINAQFAATDGAADMTATVLTDDDGTQRLAMYSKTRDFSVVDGDTVGTKVNDRMVYGYEALFGANSGTDASKNQLDGVTTIGDVANSKTVLRDIDKFWDTQGNFILTDPQTLTLTQGDGKTANVTIYGTDTIGDVVNKLNTAIADELGQADYLDKSDANYAEARKSFVTFVENAQESGNEAVKGTMLIRSALPGSSGAINIASSNENFYNAFSLNTIQNATESTYYVSVEDAHTGETINGIKDEKITGNVLKSRLHENIDVEFNSLTGISATWDDSAKGFVLSGSYDTGADGDVTFLHLTDNTMTFQIGANQGDDMAVNIGDMRAHALGVDKVLVTDRESASRAITLIDSAIDKVSTQRAKLGAYQNRLEYTASNLTVASENLTSAESRIRDTDMASEMMNFTKLQIMLQAGTSMLAQANQLPQNVLSLVR